MYIYIIYYRYVLLLFFVVFFLFLLGPSLLHSHLVPVPHTFYLRLRPKNHESKKTTSILLFVSFTQKKLVKIRRLLKTFHS